MATSGIQRLIFTPSPDLVTLIPGSSANLPSDDGLDFANFENLWIAVDADLTAGGGSVTLALYLKIGKKWYLKRRVEAGAPGGDNILSGITSTWNGIVPVVNRFGTTNIDGDSLFGERIRIKATLSGSSASGDYLSIIGLVR